MSQPTEPHLGDVLHRATEHVAVPGLAGEAWGRARRRRVRRRAAAASLTAAAVAALVVVGTTVVRGGGDAVPAPQPTPTSLPTGPPTSVPTLDVAELPLWDPFTIPDLPRRESVLPEELDPPDDPPSVVDSPISSAVVAWPEEGEDLRVLAPDGAWRAVPGTSDAITGSLRPVVDPQISSDGRRVAMSVDAGILVVDVTTGEERVLEWPSEIAPPWDTPPGLRWQADDAGFVVLHWRHAWLVGLDGTDRRAPYPGRYQSLAVDPVGATYQHDWRRRRLVTWQGDTEVRNVPFPQCERLAAGFGLVACTTGSLDYPRSGPVVVDPTTGELLAHVPIRDRDSVYSDNGGLTALGFVDSDTVLLLVTPTDFRARDVDDARSHLVTWHVSSTRFERMTSGGQPMVDVAVAPALLD